MKDDFLGYLVSLAARLDHEWFRSPLRARLPDGDRQRAKDRWIMRGVVLAVRLREPRPLSEHAKPCLFPGACARCRYVSGAEFVDAIHEAIPDAFSDLDDVLP
jgi:hypothetical protein